MPSAEKPTIRDIGRELGLAISTVSMALKNDRRISVGTCARVQAKAKELGYVPDPRLASVMSNLKKRKVDRLVAGLAYVAPSREFADLEKHPIYRNYFEGAKERAEQLGYRLENFNMQAEGISGKRLVSILRSRGIEGVVISPIQHVGQELDINWSKLSAITFGYSVTEVGMNRVAIDQYLAVLRSLEGIARHGYRRIGFVTRGNADGRMQNRWKAALLAFQNDDPTQAGVPIFQGTDREAFLDWFEKHKPDAVLGNGLQWAEYLHEEGLRCPDDYGYATMEFEAQAVQRAGLADPELREQLGLVAGMNQGSRYIGGLAVELLAQDLSLNLKGPSSRPKTTLVEGAWMDGDTLISAK